MEDTLHQAIECAVDPWNIPGFGAQFSLFPAIEHDHDHRVDDLIDLVNDIFDLYARAGEEAAAAGQTRLRNSFPTPRSLGRLVGSVCQHRGPSIEGISGREA